MCPFNFQNMRNKELENHEFRNHTRISTTTPLTQILECAAMMNGTFGEMGSESEGSEGERVRALVHAIIVFYLNISIIYLI